MSSSYYILGGLIVIVLLLLIIVKVRSFLIQKEIEDIRIPDDTPFD